MGVICTTQPPSKRSRWTPEAIDPNLFTYLNTAPINMRGKKTSVFTDGKHATCFEDILSPAWQTLPMTVTSTLATLRRLAHRAHDMNTGLPTSAQMLLLRQVQDVTCGTTTS